MHLLELLQNIDASDVSVEIADNQRSDQYPIEQIVTLHMTASSGALELSARLIWFISGSRRHRAGTPEVNERLQLTMTGNGSIHLAGHPFLDHDITTILDSLARAALIGAPSALTSPR